MSRPLVDLLDGTLAVADGRLAPDGVGIVPHYLLVARRVAEAETALGHLEREPIRLRASDASYALGEAALACWGLAVRLRARFTAAHAVQASDPLRASLRALACGDPGPASVDTVELLGDAARAVLGISPAVEVAEHHDVARPVGDQLDGSIERFAAVSIISLLRISARVQDDDLR